MSETVSNPPIGQGVRIGHVHLKVADIHGSGTLEVALAPWDADERIRSHRSTLRGLCRTAAPPRTGSGMCA